MDNTIRILKVVVVAPAVVSTSSLSRIICCFVTDIGFWLTKMENLLSVINAGQTGNKDICIFSYNSRGFSQMKQDYCQLLVSKQTAGNRIPILCNQEHFILRGNSYKINQSLPGFYCIINPAIKETHDKGRAKNGMFIAVPSSMKRQIEDVSPG